jgi:hypothetical protein
LFGTKSFGMSISMTIAIAVVAVVVSAAAPCLAQAPAPAEPAHDVDALAKQTQNPVGDLISVPLQFNFNTGGDLEQRTFLNLNVQPVIPFKLTDNWKVIARTIVPINSAPGPGTTRYSGVGDIQEQVFITPARPGGIIWGVGPALSLPTATSSAFETGTWGLGATAVVLKMAGPWVLGALATQIWPIADEGGDPETDLFTTQPFINYNFGHGWALSFSPIITANWNGPDDNQWTVPLGAGITKTTVFNRRPMNLGVQYFYNVEHPDGAGGQQLRFTLALLYPR